MNAAAMMVPGRSREDDGSVDIGALPTGGAAPAEDAPAQQRVEQRQEGQRDDGERARPAEEHARAVDHRRAAGPALHRAEARRVGKECARTCRARWAPYI